MVASERLVTVEEFWKLLELPENTDRTFELINGVVVQNTPHTFNQSVIAARIGARLLAYVDEHDLGKVAVEVDHYNPPDKFNTRRPDVEFISKARLREFDSTGYVPLMPDLAIEVKSPTNTPEDLRQKAAYYLQNGSRMVWLVYPDAQAITVYTPDNPAGHTYTAADTLDAGDVLPGFTLPLSAIFRD